MSLINDALKRAQSQRGNSSGQPAAPAASAGAHAPGSSHTKAQLPAWVMVAGGVVGGLALATIVFVAARPSPASSPATVREAPDHVAPVANESQAADSAAELPVVKTAEPLATFSNPPLPLTPPPAAQEETAPAPTARPAQPPPAEPSAGPARPSLRMVNAIEALRVTGIRAAGADSKVLMNDRVFRLGDVVDHELAIRLTGATANSLTFVDESGATYTRNFN